MDRIFLLIFVLIFLTLFMFMVGNTVMSIIFPIMNTTAAGLNSSGMLNMDNYTSQQNAFWAYFYTALFILVIAPFIYLFVRVLFKKEPNPYEQPYPYGGGY